MVHISTKFRSPNHDARKSKIDTIIIHSTHMPLDESIEKLCDSSSGVSCHYIIGLDGSVHNLVDDAMRAWHAGKSFWKGKTGINDNSIGIELVDTNDFHIRTDGFTDMQMKSLIELLKQLIKTHSIHAHNVLAHSDIAVLRKDDPGEKFNWQMLHENGIGMYHNVNIAKTPNTYIAQLGDSGPHVLKMQEMFSRLGYELTPSGTFDEQSKNVLLAFRRHFNQVNFEYIYTTLDEKILLELVDYK